MTHVPEPTSHSLTVLSSDPLASIPPTSHTDITALVYYIYKTRGMTPEWKKAKLADKSFDGYIKELKVEREKISWFGFRYNTMETMGGLQLAKASAKNVTTTR